MLMGKHHCNKTNIAIEHVIANYNQYHTMDKMGLLANNYPVNDQCSTIHQSTNQLINQTNNNNNTTTIITLSIILIVYIDFLSQGH
jgi:hypothetical protein